MVLALTLLFPVFGKASKLDSLVKSLSVNSNDSIKARTHFLIIQQLKADQKPEIINYFKEGESYALRSKKHRVISDFYTHTIHFLTNNLNAFSLAFELINGTIENLSKTDNYFALSEAHMVKGRHIFEALDMVEECHASMLKSAEYAKLVSSEFYMNRLYILGWFECNTGHADSALKHLETSYKLSDPEKVSNHSLELLNWIGNAHYLLKDYHKALAHLLRSAKLSDSLKMDYFKYDSYRYASRSYIALNMPDSAIYYTKQTVEYLLQTKNYGRTPYIISDLIRYFTRANRLNEVDPYIKILLDTTNYNYKSSFETRYVVDRALYTFYKAKNDYKTAFNYLYDYTATSDSSEANIKRSNLTGEDLKYEFQKQQEQEKLEQQQKDFEAQDKLRKQKLFNYGMLAVVLVICILLFMAYKIIKQKQAAFKEISLQKQEVENQKAIVDTKNKEIHDSITYAKRLQEAIMPDSDYLKSHFTDSLLYYVPKDIVAGDFYFFEKTADQLILAAADCTGHGVPGALVSVVCSNALTRSINEFNLKEPGQILDKTRELVVNTFEKSQNNVRDGMDISLVTIKTQKGNITNEESVEINWSGANNPLWIIHNNAFKEIKGHKQSIGKADVYTNFPTHTLTLKKGDVFYLITDGYADQFGGENGKKFKYKPLIEMLSANSGQSMAQQQALLDKTFTNWKGDLEQVDDVCIIGVRV